MALVLLVDAVFVALYLLGGFRQANDGVKLAFTLGWTLITLAVVIRGLTRIRRARVTRALGRPD